MFIYALHNLKNGKLYIGQTTVSIEKRYSQHCSDSKREDCKLYRAMRKYGIESFIYYEVDTADSIDQLNEKEDFWIKKLDTIKNGYNTKGGGKNARHSKETCEKISKARKGIKFSDSHRENLSKASQARDNSHLDPWKKKPGQLSGEKHYFYGVKRPEISALNKERLKDGVPQSTRDKISQSLKGRFTGENHHRYGVERSEEEKQRLRNLAPKIAIRCVQTGQEFESLKEASKKLGIHISSISKVVKGERNSVYGLTFEKIQKEI